ncbi:MAG: hypothetical protein EOO01_09495 [Chitinophagaceae bacterium]|nr:MAG: hypothetical protein EOO01_09495 [Chitinophagaceae bacterium]
MMVNILCDNITNRLAYTLNFIFIDVLRVKYKIVSEVNSHEHYPLICYGDKKTLGAFHIKSAGLLYETSIDNVDIKAEGDGENCVLFPIEEGDMKFDIFSAVFFLISRYEEYLSYEEDLYKRFPHTSSIAYQHGFLHYPLVNKWINDLTIELEKRFPKFKSPAKIFTHIPTYDIDIPWAYKHKGFLRNLGGWLRSPGLERLKVLCNLAPDPFDSFSFLKRIHKEHDLNPIFFWLVANKRGKLDKNISPQHPAMKRLVKDHALNKNGLHPSWHSHTAVSVLEKEKKILEKLINVNITASRQHYLRLRLPETYENLISKGITDEFSMGYGTINGFRASTSTAFNWFNLRNNEETSLRIHPFCFMDANSFYEQKQTAGESFNELMNYTELCRKEGGALITIFHNNFLGGATEFSGWKELYKRFIQEVHS